MANKTKQQLLVENNTSFPNNNTGFITPDKLRTFHEDVIDSFINNQDSSSLTFDSGSLLTTASAVNDTITFTKGDNTTFDVTITAQADSSSLVTTSSFNEYTQSINTRLTGLDEATASLQSEVDTLQTFSGSVETKFDTLSQTTSSLEQFTSSADGRLNNIELTTQSLQSSVDQLEIFSGSTEGRLNNIEDLTGSLLQTSSNDFSQVTFTKVDGQQFTLDTTPRQVWESVKNGNGQILLKGTPVYASGSVGNAQLVFPASASVDSTMPAVYILAQDLDPDEEGYGYTHGFINGVNTSLFNAGDEVYVGENGGFTNIRPTGTNLIQKIGTVVKVDASNGSGVIQIDSIVSVPNIQEGYTWVGDSNGVAQPVSTGSWDAHSDLTSLNQFTQSAEGRLNNIELTTQSLESSVSSLESVTGSYATTGSNTFNGSQNINGSVTSSEPIQVQDITIKQGSTNGTIGIGENNFTTATFGNLVLSSVIDGGSGYTDGFAYFNTPVQYVSGPTADNYGTVRVIVSGGSVTNLTTATGTGFTSYDTILTIDATGIPGLESGSGLLFQPSAISGYSNIYMGQNAGSSITTANQNIGIGLNSHQSGSTGFGNILIGENTGRSLTNGSRNVMIGNKAGSNFNQNLGIFIGQEAGQNNTGTGNTGIGYQASRQTAGTLNFATGYTALTNAINASGNTALGGYTLATLDSGDNNFAAGYSALGNLLNGEANTALGYVAGTQHGGGGNFTSGSFHVLIGAGAKPSDNETVEEIVIGRDAVGNGSNTVTLGNQNTGGTFITSGDLIMNSSFKINTNTIGTVDSEQLTLDGVGLNAGGTFTASLSQGYVWVGDDTGRTYEVSTGSFGGGGTPTDITSLNLFTQSADSRLNNLELYTQSQDSINTQLLNASSSFAEKFDTIGSQSGSWGGGGGGGFPYTGDAQISGSLGVTGSMSGYVNTLSVVSNTASIDFTDGNMFTLDLTASTTTHITSTNRIGGQTINLLITQPAGGVGTTTFSPEFKFAGGLSYLPTSVTGSKDIVTLSTWDTTDVYVTAVKNLK